MTRMAKDTAVISIPKPIFRGAEGSFPFLLSQPKNPTTSGRQDDDEERIEMLEPLGLEHVERGDSR